MPRRKLRVEIVNTGAPYPYDSWWRIKGSNGRIMVHSEKMGKKNSKKAIKSIVDAIKKDKVEIVEVDYKGREIVKPSRREY
jgi:uncharacterized protein YegP (UPF0339 family)